MPAETADNVGRIGRGVADRMDVGNHSGTGIPERSPGIPGFLEKTQIFRAVHTRARNLAKTKRSQEFVPTRVARVQSREQAIGALGGLGGAPDDAPHQEELRRGCDAVMNAALEPQISFRRQCRLVQISAASGIRCSGWRSLAPAAGGLAAAMATIWASRLPIRDDAPRSNE